MTPCPLPLHLLTLPMNPAYLPDDFFRRHAPEDIFGSPGPYEVDLGCGDGSFLVRMAAKHPDRRFLGVERLLGRVRSVCGKAAREHLDNLKVLRMESSYFLEWFIEPGSISRLHYLFPDPWPKARHFKNRLIRDSLVPVIHASLVPGGEFLFKTDHEEYFEWVDDHFERSGLFTRLSWEEESFFYPKTDFQLQWEGQGKRIYCARYAR